MFNARIVSLSCTMSFSFMCYCITVIYCGHVLNVLFPFQFLLKKCLLTCFQGCRMGQEGLNMVIF